MAVTNAFFSPTAVDHSGGFVRAHISRVPYLPGLDGMRAIAVVAVMIYHANNSWLPGGFLGVEMFFVISGYLITLLLIAERERTYRISLVDFWLRRARRLLPALFLLMGLLTVWTALFERDALGQLRGDVFAGFFYVSNWYQVWVGLGYTATGDFAPLRHLWSLAVEEQFYLVWPLVMVAFLGRTGTRRVANFSRWLFVGAIGITILVGLAYHPGVIGEPEVTPEAYWNIAGRPISKLDTLYLSTVARAGGLLLGAGFAMVWRPFAIVRGPLRDRGRAFDVVAVLAFAGFGWMCWNIHLVDPSGADGRLFRGGLFGTGILTLLIIAAVTHQGSAANRLLGGTVLTWIGTRSYGLYLYHWPIYQIIRNVAGNSLRLHEFLLAMIPTLIITELSYRFVETPIRIGGVGALTQRVRNREVRRPTGLLVGAVAITVVMATFAGVTLATADLKQNDITESLADGEDFTVSLSDAEIPVPVTIPPVAVAPTTVSTRPSTTDPAVVPTPTTLPDGAESTPVTTADAALTTVPPTAAAPVVGPASTIAPPPTTLAPAPVPQLGVITDFNAITPLALTPATTGLPLVAVGDSVMLGAAEELTASGFVVDAVTSRQLISYVPELEAVKLSGALTSVIVVHLGTNGPFSDASLALLMSVLVDVPTVVMLTGKGDRDWIAGNNGKIRALPGIFPNVTVLDWEVMSASCEGRCFYDDGIHLTQSGQKFYSLIVNRLLGLA
ncbi:MAG: peptidoglycan/LPS O-acetylase OafA/YrhL [Candidatus Azotimanducaceae bacterium]|jgi:peptidoglycan/LPS O-acetylase OafA/YrhL